MKEIYEDLNNTFSDEEKELYFIKAFTLGLTNFIVKSFCSDDEESGKNWSDFYEELESDEDGVVNFNKKFLRNFIYRWLREQKPNIKYDEYGILIGDIINKSLSKIIDYALDVDIIRNGSEKNLYRFTTEDEYEEAHIEELADDEDDVEFDENDLDQQLRDGYANDDERDYVKDSYHNSGIEIFGESDELEDIKNSDLVSDDFQEGDFDLGSLFNSIEFDDITPEDSENANDNLDDFINNASKKKSFIKSAMDGEDISTEEDDEETVDENETEQPSNKEEIFVDETIPDLTIDQIHDVIEKMRSDIDFRLSIPNKEELRKKYASDDDEEFIRLLELKIDEDDAEKMKAEIDELEKSYDELYKIVEKDTQGIIAQDEDALSLSKQNNPEEFVNYINDLQTDMQDKFEKYRKEQIEDIEKDIAEHEDEIEILNNELKGLEDDESIEEIQKDIADENFIIQTYKKEKEIWETMRFGEFVHDVLTNIKPNLGSGGTTDIHKPWTAEYKWKWSDDENSSKKDNVKKDDDKKVGYEKKKYVTSKNDEDRILKLKVDDTLKAKEIYFDWSYIDMTPESNEPELEQFIKFLDVDYRSEQPFTIDDVKKFINEYGIEDSCEDLITTWIYNNYIYIPITETQRFKNWNQLPESEKSKYKKGTPVEIVEFLTNAGDNIKDLTDPDGNNFWQTMLANYTPTGSKSGHGRVGIIKDIKFDEIYQDPFLYITSPTGVAKSNLWLRWDTVRLLSNEEAKQLLSKLSDRGAKKGSHHTITTTNDFDEIFDDDGHVKRTYDVSNNLTNELKERMLKKMGIDLSLFKLILNNVKWDDYVEFLNLADNKLYDKCAEIIKQIRFYNNKKMEKFIKDLGITKYSFKEILNNLNWDEFLKILKWKTKDEYNECLKILEQHKKDSKQPKENSDSWLPQDSDEEDYENTIKNDDINLDDDNDSKDNINSDSWLSQDSDEENNNNILQNAAEDVDDEED